MDSERPKCGYCGEPATLVTGRVLFPKRATLRARLFWRCEPCDAHVGCHPKSARPLGTLARQSLRVLRMRAHAEFDPLWQRGAFASRAAAYAWLAEQLGVAEADCHIGQFDESQCLQVLSACARLQAKGVA